MNQPDSRVLRIGVKCRNFRDSDSLERDDEFQSIKSSVADRDGYSCCYCGDSFEKYMEVHHKDGNHTNHDQNNLELVCVLCHACHHIGLTGIQGRGVIAYIPELTQIEINKAYKILMCIGSDAMVHPFSQYFIRVDGWTVKSSILKDPKTDKSTFAPIMGADSFIKNRVDLVDKYKQDGWSDPAKLGDILLSLSDDDYRDKNRAIEGLRLIPVIQGYQKQIIHWTLSFSKKYPLDKWDELLKSKIKKS